MMTTHSTAAATSMPHFPPEPSPPWDRFRHPRFVSFCPARARCFHWSLQKRTSPRNTKTSLASAGHRQPFVQMAGGRAGPSYFMPIDMIGKLIYPYQKKGVTRRLTRWIRPRAFGKDLVLQAAVIITTTNCSLPSLPTLPSSLPISASQCRVD